MSLENLSSKKSVKPFAKALFYLYFVKIIEAPAAFKVSPRRRRAKKDLLIVGVADSIRKLVTQFPFFFKTARVPAKRKHFIFVDSSA
jgi:hypothetical protein